MCKAPDIVHACSISAYHPVKTMDTMRTGKGKPNKAKLPPRVAGQSVKKHGKKFQQLFHWQLTLQSTELTMEERV